LLPDQTGNDSLPATKNQQPYPPPDINPDLENLPPIERSAEVLCYSYKTYVPQGSAAAKWIELNVRVFLWLLPILILAPMVAFIVAETIVILEGVYLVIVNLLAIVILLILIGVILFALLGILRFLSQ